MQYKRIIYEILANLRSQKNILINLQNKLYPSLSPLIFLSCLIKITEKFEEKVITILREYVDSQNNENIGSLNELRNYLIVVRRLSLPIQWIEKAGSGSVPWSLINPIEEIVHSADKSSILIMAAQNDYQYSYIDFLNKYYSIVLSAVLEHEEFENLILEGCKEVEKFSKKRDGSKKSNQPVKNKINKLGFILFPKIERNSIFQHVLIGHEIGHNFFDNYSAQLKNLDDKKNEIIGKIEKKSKELQKEDKSKSLAVVKFGLMLSSDRYIIQGISEIFCDLICLHLFGLSTLFAMQKFGAALQSIDDLEGHYPPWRYRLRVIMKYINIDALTEQVSSINLDRHHETDRRFIAKVRDQLLSKLSELKEQIKISPDLANINAEPGAGIAYELIDARLGKINECVNDALKNNFKIASIDLDINSILKLCCRLHHGITPNEIYNCLEKDWQSDSIIDYRHIIIAGWIYRICWLEYEYKVDDYLRELSKANRLTLKAIELNDVERKWFKKKSS